MATQVTNYQCPGCTGPLKFSPQTGKLECEYCGGSYTTTQVEEYYAAKNEKAEAAAESAAQSPASEWGREGERMRSYLCPSCGAELICEDTTAATACPYCGNPSVVPGQFGETRRPDYVIPFRVEKEAAVEALRRHYRGKPLLPGAFASESHLQEVKGIYVPFWLFDGAAKADVTFEATRSHSVMTPNARVVTTEYFEVRRSGTVEFERVPVDASSKMPDAHMDAIEPYDYADLKPFALAYLPGFLADKYDVGAEECAARADERCRNSAVAAMQSDVTGYDTCAVRHADVQLRRESAQYALMPVWLLSTVWKEKNYLFAMNGQTGKLIGDLPVSGGKLAAWFAGLFAVFTLLGYLMFPLDGALLGGACIAAVICAVMAGMMKTAWQQTDAHGYISALGTRITGRSDRFLRRNVVRHPIQNNNRPGGGTPSAPGGFRGAHGGRHPMGGGPGPGPRMGGGHRGGPGRPGGR